MILPKWQNNKIMNFILNVGLCLKKYYYLSKYYSFKLLISWEYKHLKYTNILLFNMENNGLNVYMFNVYKIT